MDSAETYNKRMAPASSSSSLALCDAGTVSAPLKIIMTFKVNKIFKYHNSASSPHHSELVHPADHGSRELQEDLGEDA